MRNQYWFRRAFKFPWIFTHQIPRNTLTSKEEGRWNSSPEENFLLRDASTALPGSDHTSDRTNQSPGESSLLRNSFQKNLFPGVCNGHFPQQADRRRAPSSAHGPAPPEHPKPHPPKHFSLTSGYITYWKASQVGRESLILPGISFIWVWRLGWGGGFGGVGFFFWLRIRADWNYSKIQK